MTAHSLHLTLAQVRPGMSLSNDLLDKQGHRLLPQGAVLTETMLAAMPRHGIDSLPIAAAATPTAEELQAERAARQQRLALLFRKHRWDSGSEADWAIGALRRRVTAYRLGDGDEVAA